MNEQPAARLSKSRYMAGLQCPKLLWWRVHDPQARELAPDLVTRARFEEGHRVGERARRQVPGGRLLTLAPDASLEDRVLATRRLLETGHRVIYEACFMAERVFVAVDILERLEDDSFVLIEVKSTTSVREEHVADVAVQAYVLERSGLRVGRVEIMHLDSGCTFPDTESLFVRRDVSAEVEVERPRIPARLAELLRTLEGPMPEPAIGVQCRRPRDCPFISRCWSEVPRHHVTALHGAGGRAFELLAEGYAMIRDIPAEFGLGEVADRQRRALLEGRMIVEDGLSEALRDFEPPLAYLDFETVGPALPVWNGCRPFEAVPAQFSCRIETADGMCEIDWIGNPGEDPRPELAVRVVEACRGARTIVAYNAAFEAGCLDRLEQAVPALASELASVRSRLRDLLAVTRDFVYHPEQDGRLGLKTVAPLLAPGLGNPQGGIGDGQEASVWLARLILEGKPDDLFDRERVREMLRRYCRFDTLATQRVFERLRELGATPRSP
jgi:hypothetical protein